MVVLKERSRVIKSFRNLAAGLWISATNVTVVWPVIVVISMINGETD